MERSYLLSWRRGIAEVAKSNAESATRIAEDAGKSKTTILVNMSHEHPHAYECDCIGFTKVVLKTDLSAKQKEYPDRPLK